MSIKKEAFDTGCDLNTAIRYHQIGEFQKAEEIYNNILGNEPKHPDAMHLLGVIFHQKGIDDHALTLIQEAIRYQPHTAFYYCSLGDVFSRLGRFDDAILSYQKAIRLRPGLVEAYYNMGNAYQLDDNLDEAVASYQKALEFKPDFVHTHQNLAGAFKKKGDFTQAIFHYQKVLDLKPDAAEIHFILGDTFFAQSQYDQAIVCYRKALEIKPDNAEIYYQLGNAFKALNHLDSALSCYQKALDLKPDQIELFNNMAVVLYEQNKFEKAALYYQKSMDINANDLNVCNNLGTALHKLGKLDKAILYYKKTLQLSPNDSDAYNNLGEAYKDSGKIQKAIAVYQKAIELNPSFSGAHSNLMLAMHYDPFYDNGRIFSESGQWWQQHGLVHAEKFSHDNLPVPDRRLKIGYVSHDFRFHSVSYFFLPLLAAHDRNKVEIFCYSAVKSPDQMTERLRKIADHWCAIAQLTDEALAEQVHQDGIDILVDLAGHTAGNRLQMFARKPAPVQVTWLGYPNTTGMPVIDYRLTDDIADPPGRADQFFIESLVRLPHGFLCYKPPEVAPDVAGLPAREAGRITFGSFNILPKMNASVIALWSQILNQVSGSCLLLKCRQLGDEPTRRVYLDLFARHKISADRIKMLPQTTSTHEHLALYNKVDIALDPFPYNGTTTTCEALWMGVPVVTLEGGRHSARVGASILTRVGLAELITGNQAAYVTKAVELARDLERLTQLRSQLRRRMQTSPLCDTKIFARQVEEKYQDMWYAWCRQKM